LLVIHADPGQANSYRLAQSSILFGYSIDFNPQTILLSQNSDALASAY
jgi:hypothetical protein